MAPYGLLLLTCRWQIALVVEHVVGSEQAEAGGAAGVQHERGQPNAGGSLMRGGEGGVCWNLGTLAFSHSRDDDIRRKMNCVLLATNARR